MSGATPARPVRIALSFAPDGGAWPRRPTVLVGQALRLYLLAWDVAGDALSPADIGTVTLRVQPPDGPQMVEQAEAGQGIGALSFGLANSMPGDWRAVASLAAPAPAKAEIRWSVQEQAAPEAVEEGTFLMTDDGEILLWDDGEALGEVP